MKTLLFTVITALMFALTAVAETGGTNDATGGAGGTGTAPPSTTNVPPSSGAEAGAGVGTMGGGSTAGESAAPHVRKGKHHGGKKHKKHKGGTEGTMGAGDAGGGQR